MWRHIQRSIVGFVVLTIAVSAVGLVYAQAKHYRLLSVQTGSMTPTFRKGDLVTVTRVPTAQLAIGDVITFVNPHQSQQTMTHRIVRLPSAGTNGYFVTKGDANPIADTPIAPSAVLGKVTHHVPFVGYAADIVRQPFGLVLVIYLPALAIIGEELRRLMRYYKKQQGYRLPGAAIHFHAPVHHRRRGVVIKTAAFCAIVSVLMVVPVQAAFENPITMANNSISTAPVADHVLFRRITFECSPDNTGTLNRLPEIFIYNPLAADTPGGGWYIQSSRGRIATFRPQTVFDAHDDYDIEPDLKDGLAYAGDYLALFDQHGTLIDAVSWGADTSYLHPALPGVSDGTVFRRFTTLADTGTAADWTVSNEPCTATE